MLERFIYRLCDRSFTIGKLEKQYQWHNSSYSRLIDEDDSLQSSQDYNWCFKTSKSNYQYSIETL